MKQAAWRNLNHTILNRLDLRNEGFCWRCSKFLTGYNFRNSLKFCIFARLNFPTWLHNGAYGG